MNNKAGSKKTVAAKRTDCWRTLYSERVLLPVIVILIYLVLLK